MRIDFSNALEGGDIIGCFTWQDLVLKSSPSSHRRRRQSERDLSGAGRSMPTGGLAYGRRSTVRPTPAFISWSPSIRDQSRSGSFKSPRTTAGCKGACESEIVLGLLHPDLGVPEVPKVSRMIQVRVADHDVPHTLRSDANPPQLR